jgi:hypothetical protein
MLRKMSYDQRLQYGTCRIESRFASGAVAVGTGFYYAHRIDSERAEPLIVTNRHVIWDEQEGPAVGGQFQVHTSRLEEGVAVPAGVFHDLEFAPENGAFHELWTFHEDPSVDLCAMPAASLRLIVNALAGCDPFIIAIGDDFLLAPEQLGQLNVVEDVLMVGYPTGLWDSLHNFPLFRKGTTATHPAVDFQGRPEFVVDLACFPGSSGSPVFVVREAGYPWQDHVGDPRRLLGVLHAGPVLPGTGMMVNLGYVIQAEKIRELATQMWSHFSEIGYIPAPWSSSWDTSLLPEGSRFRGVDGNYRDVHDAVTRQLGTDQRIERTP